MIRSLQKKNPIVTKNPEEDLQELEVKRPSTSSSLSKTIREDLGDP